MRIGSSRSRARRGELIDSAEDDSPYPEVRSAVANTDDPTMPVSSLRSWVIGLIWAIIIPGMNQFFFFRFPSVSVGGVCCVHISPLTYFDRLLSSDCCSASIPPCRPCVGEVHAELQDLRCLS